MMSKFYIQKFDPQIYPRKLWVAKGGTFEDIKALFIDQSGGELIEGKNCLAVTYMVQEKSSGYLGQLIWFLKTKDMTIRNITHEAFPRRK